MPNEASIPTWDDIQPDQPAIPTWDDTVDAQPKPPRDFSVYADSTPEQQQLAEYARTTHGEDGSIPPVRPDGDFNLSPLKPDDSDWLGVGEEVRGFGRALERGGRRFRQSLDVTAMRQGDVVESDKTYAEAKSEYEQARSEFEKNFPYDGRFSLKEANEAQDKLDALQMAAVRARDAERFRKRAATAAISFSKQAAEIEKLPETEAQKEFAKAQTPWWHFFKNPFELSAVTLAESAPVMAATIAAAPTGPVGVAAVAGLGSWNAESSGRVVNAMSEAGVDLKNPEAVMAWFADKAKSEPALAKADLAALGPAAFDALTAGLAGTFLRGALGQGKKKILTATLKEMALQMAGGGAGSITGSAIAKEPIDWKDVVLEVAGEFAPGEAFSNVKASGSKQRVAAPATDLSANEQFTQELNQREIATEAPVQNVIQPKPKILPRQTPPAREAGQEVVSPVETKVATDTKLVDANEVPIEFSEFNRRVSKASGNYANPTATQDAWVSRVSDAIKSGKEVPESVRKSNSNVEFDRAGDAFYVPTPEPPPGGTIQSKSAEAQAKSKQAANDMAVQFKAELAKRAEEKGKAKEPWEMSRKEYSEFYYGNLATEQPKIGNFPGAAHEQSVINALSSGKIVSHPDYPSLGLDPKSPLTPLMKQYGSIKQNYPDSVLLIRIGDFYEAFWDDAKRLNQLAGVALTKRNNVPMAGVPYHAINSYVSKLEAADHKVKVVEDYRTESQPKQPAAPIGEGKGSDIKAMNALQGQDSVPIADVTLEGQQFVIRLKRMGGGQSDLSITIGEKGGSQRVLSRVNSGSSQTVSQLLDYIKSDLLNESATITPREIKTIEQKKAAASERETNKSTSEFKKRFGREPTPTEVGLFETLKRRETVRYKTYNDEKQIATIIKQIEANPDKWQVGDGVGWKVVGNQINRGFKIVDIDAEGKTVTVRQVADTGLTSSGGNADVVPDTVVRMSDLVRDKKYNQPTQPAKSGEGESLKTGIGGNDERVNDVGANRDDGQAAQKSAQGANPQAPLGNEAANDAASEAGNQGMQSEVVERDLASSGKVLRATNAKIAQIFSDADRVDIPSGKSSALGTVRKKSIWGNLRAGTAKRIAGIFEKTRIFIETPEGALLSSERNAGILARRILQGSYDGKAGLVDGDVVSRLVEKMPGLKVVIHDFGDEGFNPNGTKRTTPAQYRPASPSGKYDIVEINSRALKNYNLSSPDQRARLDAVLTEELLHAVTYRVSTSSELSAVWKSLTDQERADAIEAYGEDTGNDSHNGAEYVRMVVQERLTGKTTETHDHKWRVTDEVRARLKEILKFLKDAFGLKPSNDIVRQVIERIEGAIRGDALIERSAFESADEALRTSQANAAAFYSRLTRTVEQPQRSNISGEPTNPKEDELLKSKAFKANAELADELGIIAPQEDEAGVPTKVGDVYDMVLSRPGLNAAVREASVSNASNALNEAGLKATQSDDGLFQLVDETKSQEVAGQKLVSILEREIQSARADNRPERIANLLNTIVVHLARDKNKAFSQELKNKLYYLAQGERSSFGRALGGLAMWGKVLANVAQNPKLHLDRIYSDAFGGDLVRRIMDRIASNFQQSFTGAEIERLYNANPKLRELFDNVVNRLKVKPSLRQVIDEIFATPIYKQEDLVNRFVDTMVNKFSATPEEAAMLKAEFSRTFSASFAAARKKAQEQALKSLTPQEAKVIGAGTPLWKKITNLVNAGGFGSGDILTTLAKERGWTVPSEAELAQMQEWSAREQRLREPTQRQLDKFGGDIAKATKEAEVGTEQERIALIKKMQATWSRWSMPVKWFSLNPEISRNRAKAINEFVGANLLLKLGFLVRQAMDVGITSMPLNAINRSIVHIIERAQNNGGFSPEIIKDMDAATREMVTARIASIKATIRQMERTATGHTNRRVLDRMAHSIGIFERMAVKADGLEAKGNIAGARAVRLATLLQAGYRVAAIWDSIQSVGLEWQEMRQQLSTDLRAAGKSHLEIKTQLDDIFGGLKVDMLEALKEAEAIGNERGLTKDKATLQNDAWNLIKAKAYDRMRKATGNKTDYQFENEQLRELHSWNLPETGGIGGLLADTIKTIRSKTEKAGVPTGGLFSFGNAIGIAANRMATFSGGGLLGGWGFGTSPWYQGERNIKQRRIEAVEGLAVIGIMVALAAAGKALVQVKYPDDKDEKERFIAEGHKLNTIRFVNDDGSWFEAPIQMSPFSFVAPPIYMIGGIQRLLTTQARAQAKLDADAARTGAIAGKAKGVSAGDVASVLAQGAYGFLSGGRTAGGAIQSFSDYGNFNLNKSASSFATPYIPALPAWQEAARMMGAAMDTRTATMAELLVPSPWSGHQRVNSLGDPLTNPDAVKRVVQVLTGGYSLGSETNEAASSHAYQQLFAAGYSTPEIPFTKGFNFDGVIRPMTPQEREKYTVTRGKAFKQELMGVNVDGLPQEEAHKVVQQAYQRANDTALGAISATPNMRAGRYVMPSVKTSSYAPRTPSYRPVRLSMAPRTRSAFGSRTRKPRKVALGRIKQVKIKKVSMFGRRTRSAFKTRRRGLYA